VSTPPIDVPDYLQLTQLAAPQLLGTISIPSGQQGNPTSFTVSPFATGIVIVPLAAAGASYAAIEGGVSSYVYGQGNAVFGVLAPVFAAVGGTIDNPYLCNVILAVTNPGPGAILAAYVYELFGVGIEQPINTLAQPLYTQSVGPNVPLGNAPLLSVIFAASIAASASATIIAATPGSAIMVYGYDITIRANVSATVGVYEALLEDTAAAVGLTRMDLNWATAVGTANEKFSAVIPAGLLMTLSAGLKIVAAANPGALLYAGVIYYALVT
jgi:hypothetical protein